MSSEVRPSAGPPRATRYAIDPRRCGVCGKAELGLRCGQAPAERYERALVRARIASPLPLATAASAVAATPPCTDACPLSLCVQGYVQQVAAGQYEESLEHILARTALPESVCRVCDRPCERACRAEPPVSINALKRFVVEWDAARPEADRAAVFPRQEPAHGLRVAVVGAGPAGLAAAHDLSLRGYAVSLYDAAARAGGLLAQCIPSYRLPSDALDRDLARVLATGVRFVGGATLGRGLSVRGLLAEGHAAVFLALGAHRARELELPRLRCGVSESAGAEAVAPRVVDALGFLKAVRAGTEPRLAPGSGRVVVIGGGDAAIDAARVALRLGAGSVSVVCLESRAAMPALRDQLEDAEREGVRVVTEHRPVGLAGSAVAFERLDASAPLELGADLLVTAIGQEPELAWLDAEGELPLARTEDGRLLVAPETGRTSDPRVYAGGDLVATSRTVTGAMGAGLRAAFALDRALRGDEAARRRPPPPLPKGPAEDRLRSTTALADGRVSVSNLLSEVSGDVGADACARDEASPASGDFAELARALSEDAARAEAARCRVCGLCGNCRACIELFGCPALVPAGSHVRIDPALCNGCGVCVAYCPSGAIRPVEAP